jgi:hypothetical protein
VWVHVKEEWRKAAPRASQSAGKAATLKKVVASGEVRVAFAQEALGVDFEDPESELLVDVGALEVLEESDVLVEDELDEPDEPDEPDDPEEPRASFL